MVYTQIMIIYAKIFFFTFSIPLCIVNIYHYIFTNTQRDGKYKIYSQSGTIHLSI
jgi:hypothetical protein